MKCSRCYSKDSVIEISYISKHLCRECFIRFFEYRVKKTIRRYAMLQPDDKIAVALSGGKDSLTLLYLLKKFSKNAPKSKLIAITIDEGIKGYREKSLKLAKEICNKLQIEHYIFSFKEQIGVNIDEIKNTTIPACSYCGVFRRDLLNKKARELGATKLATGHNLDDEVQTVLMNFIRGDLLRLVRNSINSPLKNRKFVPRIKPLRRTPEKEIALYAILNNLNPDFSECPYAGDAFRETIRNVINIIEDCHTGSKYQLLKSSEELARMLVNHYKPAKLTSCKLCGEVSSEELCKACQFKKNLRS